MMYSYIQKIEPQNKFCTPRGPQNKFGLKRGPQNKFGLKRGPQNKFGLKRGQKANLERKSNLYFIQSGNPGVLNFRYGMTFFHP